MADKLISSNLNDCIYETKSVGLSFNTSRQVATLTFSGVVRLASAHVRLSEAVYSAYLPSVEIIDVSGTNVIFKYQSAVAASLNVYVDAIITKP